MHQDMKVIEGYEITDKGLVEPTITIRSRPKRTRHVESTQIRKHFVVVLYKMSSNSNDKWLIQLVPRGDESLSAEGWIKGPEGNRSGMVAWKKLNTGRITKADVTALEELMGNVTIGQTYSVPQDANVEEVMGIDVC